MKKPIMIFLIFILAIGCSIGNSVPSAYAPIRYNKAAAEFIEKDDMLDDDSFQYLSNCVRVLYNCGIVPFTRIERVEDVESHFSEEESKKYHCQAYAVKCSCDNRSFTIDAARPLESKQLDLSYIVENGQYIFHGWTYGWRDYQRNNPEETRQISFTALKEHCNLSEKESNGIMKELDLLFTVRVIPFYDIASIEQAERHKNAISLSLTSNFGEPYNIVISTGSRPIILSISDSKGKVLYASV